MIYNKLPRRSTFIPEISIQQSADVRLHILELLLALDTIRGRLPLLLLIRVVELSCFLSKDLDELKVFSFLECESLHGGEEQNR